MIKEPYLKNKNRGSGLLLHISSLPNYYGIGTIGKEAREFGDFLEKSGQKYWQLLPVGPTSYGDSPYQSYSTFAGNPFFIDLEALKREGILEEDYLSQFINDGENNKVDYEKVNEEKYKILREAYSNFNVEAIDFQFFKNENSFWLKDFSLFMALKEDHNGKPWIEWEDEYKFRDPEALKAYQEENQEKIDFYNFTQYNFYRQWFSLKDYLGGKNIRIIGDLPIYVAEDSSDTWANPELFKLNEDLSPEYVGGVPPDAFSEDGQLWGNPVYNWEVHEQNDFKWWIERIRWTFSIFDIVRIDHFRGFEAFWEVPFGEKTAINGRWVKGPDKKLFEEVFKELGELPIIAEDLGVITDEVIELKEYTGFPGMNVLQFGFSPYSESEYLPHNHEVNSIVYTGTHDNETIGEWLYNISEDELNFVKKYFNLTEEEGYNWGMIRGAMTSVAKISIFQVQDLLFLGEEGRMNKPGTLGNNWDWRLKIGDLNEKLAIKLKKLTRMSGRL